jgi:hypothetical protein
VEVAGASQATQPDCKQLAILLFLTVPSLLQKVVSLGNCTPTLHACGIPGLRQKLNPCGYMRRSPFAVHQLDGSASAHRSCSNVIRYFTCVGT